MTKKRFLEIVRFCFGGIIGVTSAYIILYVLTEYIGLWYLCSSIIAYIINQLVNFVIQKFWTFRNKDSKEVPKQLSLYLGIAFIYFLINTIMMYILTDYCHFYYIVSQIIMTGVLSFSSYFTTKMIFIHRT